MEGTFFKRMQEARINKFRNGRNIINASSGNLAFVETEIAYVINLGKHLEEHTNARLDKIRTTW